MRLGASGPVQHDVRGGHQLDLHDAGIQGVFTRIQGGNPDTFVSDVHEITMLEVKAADILVCFADEGDDHAHVTDRDVDHGHLLHLNKPGVHVPTAGENNLLLQSAPASAI